MIVSCMFHSGKTVSQLNTNIVAILIAKEYIQMPLLDIQVMLYRTFESFSVQNISNIKQICAPLLFDNLLY